MRVAVTGASGLIGTALVEHLRAHGHEVLRLVRGEPRRPASDEVRWQPDAGYVDLERLDGVDAVVHLAGAGIGDRPWTPARRRVVMESRTVGTRTIATAMTQLAKPPQTLISMSGINYYGDNGSSEVDETSPPGSGFLAEICVSWEAAADPARAAGIRVVHPRMGLVMTGRGGILGRLLPLYRAGLGGKLGHGRQYMSVLSLADTVSVLRFLLENADLAGPVNCTIPRAVTNAEFTATLGRLLSRPTVFRVPTLPLKLADQVVANQLSETLLDSVRARPAVLLRSGFTFQHPELKDVLRWSLA